MNLHFSISLAKTQIVDVKSSLNLSMQYAFVLVLPGIELIFLIVASVGLWFGFVLETVLIIQGCFRHC